MLRLLHKIEDNLICILSMGMVIVSFTQVVARYVFSSGWTGALELTSILFSWFIFLGAVYTMRASSHLGVDVFVSKLPENLKRFVACFAAGICCLYGLMMFDAGFIGFFTGTDVDGGALFYVEKMYKIGITTEDLNIPRWMVYIVFPFALLCWSWRSFHAMLRIWRKEQTSLLADHSTSAMDQTNT